MSTGTPIKRSPHIAALSRDHHHALLLGWKIRQGIKLQAEASRMAAYADYFYNNHLQQHFREEESLLFEELPADDEWRQQAESEHRSLRSLFAAISAHPDYDQLNTVADLLDQHIRFEERILFPHIEKTIPLNTLEKIGEALAAETHAADDWKDEFWKKGRV